jgi:hypothetical protein
MEKYLSKYLDVKIEGYGQIDASQVDKVDAPSQLDPFWTICFKDGEVINTTMPVLVHYKWEEVPNE